MQQIDGLRLEKLRGGAQEVLVQIQEGQAPLIVEERKRRRPQVEGSQSAAVSVPDKETPYKDALIGPA